MSPEEKRRAEIRNKGNDGKKKNPRLAGAHANVASESRCWFVARGRVEAVALRALLGADSTPRQI